MSLTEAAPSPAANPADHTRRLSTVECRSWLATRHEGRLTLETGRGRRSVVLTYGLTDQHLVFQIPEYNQVLQYAHGRRVSFFVESVPASTSCGQQVTVTGTGYRADATDEDSLLDSADLPERWPAGVTTHVMCLDLAVVEGLIYDTDQRTVR